MKLSIITTSDPTSSALPELLRELDKLGSRHGGRIEILIVDDLKIASPQGILAASQSNPLLEIRWMTYPEIRGQLEAILFGIHHASGDILVTIDPDMYGHVQSIPRMLEMLERTSGLIVHASRCERPGLPWWRRMGSLLANRLVSTLLAIKVRDLSSPLTLFPRELVEELQTLPPDVRNNPRPYLYAKHQSRIAELRLETPSPAHTSNYSPSALALLFFRLLQDSLRARSLLRRQELSTPKVSIS